MKQYKLLTIFDIVNGVFVGRDKTINNIFVDSRNSINNKETSLFVALEGERHNGHNYINDLYNAGIKNFVVNKEFQFENYPDASFIFVDDTLKAIQDIAAYYRHTFLFPVLAITGSNGKTIVKEWIYQIFQDIKTVSRSPKSYNSQIGVPLSVLKADTSELGIFEAGISMPGEMEKLEHILKPDIGIFTNVGDAHQENFTDIEQKTREKLILFKDSNTLIYCYEHKLLHKVITETEHSYNTFTWGYCDNCNLIIKNRVVTLGKTTLTIEVNDNIIKKQVGKEFDIEIPFTDNASVENVMHCIAFALIEKVDLDVLKNKTYNLAPVAMRLELKEGINNCTIINDSYNSDINSLSIALDFLESLTQHNNKALILSDIYQSDANEEKLYTQVAEMLVSKGINRFIGIGNLLTKYSALIKNVSKIENCHFYTNTDEFLKHYNKNNFNNEAILLKGSRQFRFERISRLLELKIHQTILEVNMDAMVNNLNYFKSKLKPGVKLMAMVKAFSYGLGSYEIAGLLQFHRVDYLAVAYADEGIALREMGITMPIVILNTDPANFDIMIEYQLEPEIYSISSLNNFLRAASILGVYNYPVHIKVDTGMHRLGFEYRNLPELLNVIENKKEIRIESVFSHLAASDESKHDGFTNTQIERFTKFCNKLEENINYPFIKHILNSSGIERFPDAQFDMVRLGIGLYGVGSEDIRPYLKNAGTLSSTIVQIKKVEKGETVGYGRHGKVDENKIIATVPIGYADGLNRKLSNGAGYFLVNGKPAPIIGNVCMDACMLDITNIENVKEGDKVIIMGETPSVYQIAKAIDTIPYEVLTSISRRVKRIYTSD